MTATQGIGGYRDRDSPRCAIGLGDIVILHGQISNMTDSVETTHRLWFVPVLENVGEYRDWNSPGGMIGLGDSVIGGCLHDQFGKEKRHTGS